MNRFAECFFWICVVISAYENDLEYMKKDKINFLHYLEAEIILLSGTGIILDVSLKNNSSMRMELKEVGDNIFINDGFKCFNLFDLCQCSLCLFEFLYLKISPEKGYIVFQCNENIKKFSFPELIDANQEPELSFISKDISQSNNKDTNDHLEVKILSWVVHNTSSVQLPLKKNCTIDALERLDDVLCLNVSSLICDFGGNVLLSTKSTKLSIQYIRNELKRLLSLNNFSISAGNVSVIYGKIEIFKNECANFLFQNLNSSKIESYQNSALIKFFKRFTHSSQKSKSSQIKGLHENRKKEVSTYSYKVGIVAIVIFCLLIVIMVYYYKKKSWKWKRNRQLRGA